MTQDQLQTPEQIVAHLEQGGDSRAVKVWQDMKVHSADAYAGWGLTRLKQLAKIIKRNHDLALALWQVPLHDAKLLATMIEEPKKVNLAQIEAQMPQIYTWDLADKYVENVLIKTPFAMQLLQAWSAPGQQLPEMQKRSGWILLYNHTKKPKSTTDLDYTAFLAQIEQEMNQERNWVREAMNYCLITLGKMSHDLHQQALAVSHAIGKVTIDYGTTSCKNPDATQVLQSARTKEQLAAL